MTTSSFPFEVYHDDYKKFIEELGKFSNSWIFRGQMNADWELIPSIARIRKKNLESNFIEKNMILQFKNSFHNYYLDSSNKIESKIETFALGQHYGLPTRLLDFTKSPYIACYFALKPIINDLVYSSPKKNTRKAKFGIWAINNDDLYDHSLYIFKSNISIINSYYGYAPPEDDEALYEKFNEIESLIGHSYTNMIDYDLDEPLSDFIFPIENFYSNKRSDLQQSIFLCPTSLDTSFHKLIEDFGISRTTRKPVRLITCNQENAISIFQELQKFNINPLSLNGDIQGSIENIILRNTIF